MRRHARDKARRIVDVANKVKRTVAQREWTCPRCERTTTEPNDVRDRWCRTCLDWTESTDRR